MITERKSEPLDAVIRRALRGESITRDLGPFFIVLSWPSSDRRLVYPRAFATVEAALLHAVENFAQLQACLEDDFELVICFKLGFGSTTLVQ